jgi:hypothetical protein
MAALASWRLLVAMWRAHALVDHPTACTAHREDCRGHGSLPLNRQHSGNCHGTWHGYTADVL